MRSATVAALAVGATLSFALGDTAGARPFGDIGGGAQLTYELATLHEVAHDTMAPPPLRDAVLAGVRLHGFVGGARLGYHVGLDLAAGGTMRAGSFAYDVSIFPFGLAVRFAETSFITLGAGVGASGAVVTIDDAVTFPLEMRFELGRGFRVLGRVRASYLGGAPGRKDGGVTLGIGDELEAMLGLRLGRGYDDYGFPTGNGYFIGATAREALGARFVGVIIGYSIDMATRRTKRSSRRWSCEDCD